MAQVSNQTELRAALNAGDTIIQLTASFTVASQLPVAYAVAISSLPGGVYTLSKAAAFSGSIFRISGGGALTLQDIILDGADAGSYEDNAANRTLVIVAGGSLHLASGSVLQNNSSYQEGGGAYLSGDPSYTNTLLMDGGARIQGCNSRTSGGGLMVALRSNGDRAVLESAVIENNTAANGGGIYFRSYTSGVGGSLMIGKDVRITGNRVTSSGGGIYFSGFREGGSAPVTLTINGQVDANSAVNGGGISFYGINAGDRLTLNGAVNRNTSTANGGGIFMTAPTGGADLQINNTAITGNEGGTGGGIYLLTASGGSVNISGSSVTNNKAENGASGSGGGVWIRNNTSSAFQLSMADTRLEGNQAAAQGGALALTTGNSGGFTMSMRGCAVTLNSAATNGGGLLIGNSGTGILDAADCVISQNTAGGSGGGLYFSGREETAGKFSADGVAVTGNTAGTEGGGLRLMSSQGTLESTITSCTVTGNTADSSSGGGIWNGGKDSTLQIQGTTLISQNSSEAGNGGGIYFNSGSGVLSISGSTQVTYNRADGRDSEAGNYGGGVYAVPGRVFIRDQAEIAYNSARKSGGGLGAAEGSVILMEGGSIHDNHSALLGGGVWNNGGSAFTLAGGSIYKNAAQTGGGLYNGSGSTATVSGGELYGNTATAHAPGIYNTGVFYTEGLRDLFNGLAVENRDAAAYLLGALVPGTAIQLDNTGYVAPNPEGVPIVVGEATPQYPLLTQADANGFLKPPEGFAGWEIRLSEDRTKVLLAPAVYTIRYENLMGSEHPNPSAYTVLTPDIVLLPPEPVQGYRFIGWYDALDGSLVTRIPQGSSGNIVLYARWEAVFHTLSYDANASPESPVRGVPDPALVQDGSGIVLSQDIPARDGYRFTEWNTEPAGNGKAYQPGDMLYAVTMDVRLYAQWEAVLPPDTHTITYDGNASCPPASCVPLPQQVLDGTSALLSLGVPARLGHRFLGWNTEPLGQGDWYPPGGQISSITQDITLYAQWKYCCGCPCCRCTWHPRQP